MTDNSFQLFFFAAMLNGWANGASGQDVAPGQYVTLKFRQGHYYSEDRYIANAKSKKSSGTTTIWYRDEPIWVMQYSGYYHDRAIPFLKSVLMGAYTNKNFIGGRGPRLVTEGPLVYTNQPRLNDMLLFEGREEIFEAGGGDFLGYHEYSGMSLF